MKLLDRLPLTVLAVDVVVASTVPAHHHCITRRLKLPRPPQVDEPGVPLSLPVSNRPGIYCAPDGSHLIRPLPRHSLMSLDAVTVVRLVLRVLGLWGLPTLWKRVLYVGGKLNASFQSSQDLSRSVKLQGNESSAAEALCACWVAYATGHQEPQGC